MASIRKKSNGMWLAQVRRVARDGLPALNRSASFPRKAEAEAWAAKIENEWRTLRFGGAVRENAFVFNITSGALDALFRKLKRRSLLENLHFTMRGVKR